MYLIKTACRENTFWNLRQFSPVQSLSCVRLFVTPWTVACQASLFITNSWSLLKLMSGVYSNSCPSSQWCHPTISSSLVPFSSLLQSFPASGAFPMSQFFTSGDQSIGVSASASVLPMNIQDWSPCSSRDSQEFSPTPQFKSIHSSALSFLYGPILTSIHDYWKKHSFD